MKKEERKPDDEDEEYKCTCKPSCSPCCKGECGCKKCHDDYMDFLSLE
jgi:hypothetical protein